MPASSRDAPSAPKERGGVPGGPAPAAAKPCRTHWNQRRPPAIRCGCSVARTAPAWKTLHGERVFCRFPDGPPVRCKFNPSDSLAGNSLPDSAVPASGSVPPPKPNRVFLPTPATRTPAQPIPPPARQTPASPAANPKKSAGDARASPAPRLTTTLLTHHLRQLITLAQRALN